MIELFVLFVAWCIFGMLNFIHVIETKNTNELSLQFFFASGPAIWILFALVVGGRAFSDWFRSL